MRSRPGRWTGARSMSSIAMVGSQVIGEVRVLGDKTGAALPGKPAHCWLVLSAVLSQNPRQRRSAFRPGISAKATSRASHHDCTTSRQIVPADQSVYATTITKKKGVFGALWRLASPTAVRAEHGSDTISHDRRRSGSERHDWSRRVALILARPVLYRTNRRLRRPALRIPPIVISPSTPS